MLSNIVEDRDIEAKWNDFKKKVTEAATDELGEEVPYRGRKKTKTLVDRRCQGSCKAQNELLPKMDEN